MSIRSWILMSSVHGASSDPNSYGGRAPAPARLSSLVYGLGVSAGILLLITTITFMSFLCMRASAASAPPPAQQRRRREEVDPAEEEAAPPGAECAVGLDEATLKGYPKVAYAEAAKRGMPPTAACCSICLADYQAADVLRLLPDCGHLFHIDCVDMWLKAHPTCPVCRSSPASTPLPTPVAEAAPLAIARPSS
ncbi:putative RING-H2 finger protein ATL71 [Curcuma longa]|uniref:putative RING-H2 finger protein ATL71 n=1 Tax=Curcuma longa TaxID=136217 RepID=UPI003D9DC3F3